MAIWETELYNNKVKFFGGVIDHPKSKDLSLSGVGKLHDIECVDWHYFLDKRLIAKAYKEVTIHDILLDWWNLYLKDEGINLGVVINPGPLLTEAVFNYVYLSDAMDALAERAAADWYIDADKNLHFFVRSENFAPHNFKEKDAIRDLEVGSAGEDYRNRQYIRAGKDTTDPQEIKFKGDGKNKSFVVPYELAFEPKVFVNGVEQRVGIRGLEENQDWYWNKGDKVVSQAESDDIPPLTSNDELKIIYQGFFDIVVLTQDQGAVAERMNVEGGTGFHDAVADEAYLTTRAAAFESANAKLKRFASIGRRITFRTYKTGLRAGQMTYMELPTYGLPKTEFLIESVKFSEIGTEDGRLWYDVSLVDGKATGGWANFFKKMANRDQKFVIRENIDEEEILITLASFSKTWQETDNPNIYRELFPGATLFPGNDAQHYPSFEPQDRVKYVTLYNGTTEIFRKPVLKQTELAPGVMVSVVLLLAYEANDMPITHVGWIGGSYATMAPNSGLIVDKQPFVKIKNDLESVQIEKTDIKGW